MRHRHFTHTRSHRQPGLGPTLHVVRRARRTHSSRGRLLNAVQTGLAIAARFMQRALQRG